MPNVRGVTKVPSPRPMATVNCVAGDEKWPGAGNEVSASVAIEVGGPDA